MKYAALALLLLAACGCQLPLNRPTDYASRQTLLDQVLDATVVVGHTVDRSTALGLSSPALSFRFHCSGVIVGQVILTADHCTNNTRRQGLAVALRGTDAEFDWIEARVIHRMPGQDLAVLQVARTLPEGVEVASSSPGYGEKIAVVGHPWGLFWTYDVGIVTFPRRNGGGVTGEQVWLQHDADTDPGDSGGPVLDSMGRLVGITSFGIGRQEGAVHLSQIKLALEALGLVSTLP